ncbi:MAG TPA: hypothetical protein VIS54_00670, partial [Psychromonas sp.]
MLKTVKQSNNKAASPEQSNFAKRWSQIEKKQKRNKALQKKIATFYTSFQSEILPEEEKMCELLAQEARHLMTFLPRKSFTQWQREELSDWIESNVNTLMEHPFCPEGVAEALHLEYTEAQLANVKKLDESHLFEAQEIEAMRDFIEEMFACGDDFSEQQLSDFLRDPALFHQHFAEHLKAAREEATEEFDEDQPDDAFFERLEEEFANSEHFQHHSHSQARQQKKLKDLFNASQLKKCYKILASRLHPDKELDPALKAQKSELMAQLAQAKKEKDAFTIITLFQQYVPDNDLNLDDDLNAELLTLLSEKLAQLDREHRQLQHADTIESMVWQKLGGRTKNIMQSKKQKHLEALLAKQVSLQQTISTAKSMKPLNKLLSDRY